MLSFLFCIESFVTFFDEVFEDSVEHTFGHGTDGVIDLVDITTLGDKLVTDLDSGLNVSLIQRSSLDSKKFADTVTFL